MQNFEDFLAKSFDFSPLIFGWMVRISEIQFEFSGNFAREVSVRFAHFWNFWLNGKHLLFIVFFLIIFVVNVVNCLEDLV